MNDPKSVDHAERLKRALVMMEKARGRIAELERARSEPIAIVGLACRFPGGADTPERFWADLLAGRDAIVEVPPERWSLERYYDPDPDAPGKVSTRFAGLIGPIDRFDAAFFGISPREAQRMDPQQRLALEVAWEALEHAGYAPTALAGARAGVFLGICANEYIRLQLADLAKIDAYVSSGNAQSIVANRISYTLDLRGPSMAVDTACSSSLVTVHLACQSLRSRDSDLALAGGVGLLVGPEIAMSLTKARMLAPDGRCKTFDARANGYVRGEGCGLVVLKRLSDALRDGDLVHAVIRGSAVNQDGATTGLTAPNGMAQQAVVRAALAAAGLEPGQVSVIEAHGTGTSLGDPIEMEALGATVGVPAPDLGPLLVGSVKTNIGHLEAASGVAGLLKLVLALTHDRVPPHLHLQGLNPNINLAGTRIQVPTRAQPWPTAPGQPRIAGVSAFGFGGTNAHVIVEEAPAAAPAPALAPAPTLLVLSAAHPDALAEQARRLAAHIDAHPEQRLLDLAFTAAVARARLPHRLALVATDLADARRQLHAAADAGPPPGAAPGLVGANPVPGLERGLVADGAAPRLAFLFTGQGAQHPGMGRALYDRYSVFRATVDRCDELARPWLGRSLRELLFAPADPPASSPLHDTRHTQPALFTLELALADLLAAWGVVPDLMIGHSIGEYVAAHLAGVFSLADALKLVVHRGQLMAERCPPGAMLAVEADLDVLRPLLDGRPISIAAVNSPRQTVLAGLPDAVAALEPDLAARGLKARRLSVSHAFHSHLLEPMLEPFQRLLEGVALAPPTRPIFSNVSGQLATAELATPDYWVRHLRAPVRFLDAVRAARDAGAAVWLELGPHPALTSLLPDLAPDAPALATLRRGKPDDARLLAAAAALFTHGLPIDPAAVFRDLQPRRVPLPTYPFQRQRYWVQADPALLARPAAGHPLLGQRQDLPLARDIVFAARYSAAQPAFLPDHVVHGVTVMPGAGLVATALAAAHAAHGAAACVVHDLAFLAPLTLAADEPRAVQIVLTPDGARSGLQIVSAPAEQAASPAAWTLHCTGRLEPGAAPGDAPALAEIQGRCPERRDGAAVYATMHALGYALGPAFQGLGDIWRRDGEALCRLRPVAAWDDDHGALHPGLIDSCFQLLAACLPAELRAQMYLPFAVDRLRFTPAARGPLWCHATTRPQAHDNRDSLVGDLVLFTADGRPVAEIGGLHLRPISRDTLRAAHDRELLRERWAFDTAWRPALRAPAGPAQPGVWLVHGDAGLAAPLHAALAARGHTVVPVPDTAPDALHQLLAGLPAPVHGLVHLAPADLDLETRDDDPTLATRNDDPTRETHPAAREHAATREPHPAAREHADTHEPHATAREHADTHEPHADDPVLAALRSAVEPVLALARALTAHAPGARLALLTRAQASLPGEAPPAHPIAPGALLGLVRAVHAEHPGARPVVLDLPPGPDAALLRDLVDELHADDHEAHVALRPDRRWVARLRQLAVAAPPPLALSAERSYLVTGGLGAIGLEVAAWLVERGARHLVLLGRGGPSPAARARLDALEQRGVTLTLAALDVADRDALARLLADLARPLDGVFHAAGVLDDASLAAQSWPRFVTVLRPKLLGALHLHHLTRDLPLTHFVLFSSAAALLGSAGQANYAAANAALDALAVHRRHLGRPALALQWGAWAGDGMAHQLGERLAALGVEPITPAQGAAMLEWALHHGDAPALMLARVDLDRYRRGLGPAASALLDDLSPRERAVPRDLPRDLPPTDLLRQLERAADDPERTRHMAEFVTATVRRVLELPAGAPVDPSTPLHDLGFDSLMAVELRNQLAAALGQPLSATLLFDHPTVSKLAAHLLSRLAPAPAPTPRPAPTTVTPAPDLDEPIAIVGLACRLPGGANDPDAYWRLLADGRDAISPIPPERWDLAATHDPDPDAPGKSYVREGGFLQGFPVDRFDAAFFGISPREAEAMDPQQRLLLELAWEGLEHAGVAPASLFGGQTGVFVGITTNDYAHLGLADPGKIGMYTGSGNANSVAAGRLSYVLGLQGPSFPVDTACSSSLVAVHLACQSLRSRESDLALACGVTLMLTPHATIFFSRLRALAPDGRCKSFDARADGYVRSEGGGLVVLKRLADARAAGDRVLAVIRGSAVNHDGRSNGLSAPNGLAQQAVIRGALRHAGLSPDAISYVEAHGTGTPLGDPIELQALGAALPRPLDRPLLVGSVKSNIGHTEAAAGIAGLIKVVLALQHRQIPRNLHFRAPNPHVPWSELGIRVPTEHGDWQPIAGRRLAGVSSFGFGGTNAHVILEEADPTNIPAASSTLAATNITAQQPDLDTTDLHLVPISARDPQALAAQARRWSDWLRGPGRDRPLAGLAHTAARRRTHFERRAAVLAGSVPELAERLAQLAADQPGPGLVTAERLPGAPRIIFVFPGQGSQWLGMGRELLAREPVFRDALTACDHVIHAETGWSLLAELHADADRSRLAQIDVVQPTLFAFGVALAALWRSWGVRPDGVIGHSMGETAAAHVAGALDLEDAARVICRRSRLMRRLSGRGAMALVEQTVAEAELLIAGHHGRLAIAVSNSPGATVLSGDPDALDEVTAELTRRQIFWRRVQVDVSSHSPQVDVLEDDLLRALADLRPRDGQVPLWSTATGARLRGAEMDAAYWWRNLRNPVRFSDMVEQASDGAATIFLELSPHPVLVPSIDQCLAHFKRRGAALASLRRNQPERAALLEALAGLHVRGHDLDGPALFPTTHPPEELPTYAFTRESYWLGTPGQPLARPHAADPDLHPLLGRHLHLADDDLHVWETELRLDQHPWLADHRVRDQILLPGAAFLEAALAAGRERHGLVPVLTDARFEQALVLPEHGALRLQLTLRHDPDGASYRLSSRRDDEPWTLHSHGRLAALDLAELPPAPPDDPEARCPDPVVPADLYERFADAGITYGPAFQPLRAIQRGHGEATAVLALPPELGPGPYVVHPVLLDGALQLAAAATGQLGDDDTWLPVGVERLIVRRSPRAGARVHVVPRPAAAADEIHADLVLRDAEGPALELRGLSARRLRAAAGPELARMAFELIWQPAPLPPPRPLTGAWLLLGDAPAADALAAAIRARGGQPHHLRPDDLPDDLAAALARLDAAEPLRGLVDLRPLDLAPPADHDALRAAIHRTMGAVQALQQLALAARPARLWLVTRRAQRVADLGGETLGAALLWGLGRSAALEHPELQPTLVDLDGGPDELEQLALALGADDPEGQLALRHGQRHLARLAPAGAWAREPAPALDLGPADAWLVTGGLTGLGLSAAAWLVERGLRHLALVGRRPPGPEAEALLAQLRQRGAHVRVVPCDLARDDAPDQLRAALADFPPLTGALHAAGHLADGVLLHMTPGRLAEVMGGKVHGAWNLHQLLADAPLRAFVLYSSAAGLVGAPGQANYAAANAFLDALAVHRRARGLPALSIAWGAFSELGLAARPDRGGRLEHAGLPSLTPAQGLAALDHLLRADPPAQLGVLHLRPRQLQRHAPQLARAPLLALLMPQDAPRAAGGALAEILRHTGAERAEALQNHLRGALARVLRLPVERLDPELPLNRLGLDSLMGVELKNRLEADLGLEIRTASLLSGVSAAELAAALLPRLDDHAAPPPPPAPPLPRADRGAPLRASPGQERLWLLDQISPERAAYNVHVALRVTGPLDPDALETALAHVVARHEALRTTFALLDGQLVQRIDPHLSLPLARLSGDADERLRAEARRPFDLARGPLLRLALLAQSEHEHLLAITAHHIIVDAWSLGLLLRELLGAYQALAHGRPVVLPELAAQFADFAAWQRASLDTPAAHAARAYWQAQLADTPILALPTDHPRPATASLRGDVVALHLPEPLTARLQALAHAAGATLFMGLLAAFQALLARYSGQTDIAVGTATAGRGHPALDQTIGFFVNTVVLRGDLRGDPDFRALLERARAVCLAAYDHQDLPFDQVVDAVRPARSPGVNPLYQVCLLLENAPVPDLDLADLSLAPRMATPDGAVPGTAKFDLTLCLVATPRGLEGSLEFSRDLFDRPTIERMAGHFLTLVAGLTEHPDRPLSRVPLLDPDERRRLLHDLAGPVAPPDPPLTLHARFAAAAAAHPERVALRDGERRITFAALERQANRLAHLLRRRDLGREPLVGLYMDSSAELVTAALAVLKAGGAYVPLDPAYPRERLAYMIADARLPLVLSTSRHAAQVPGDAPVLALDRLEAELAAAPDTPPDDLTGPDGAAYVVYTSGSTGQPKGVVGTHGAAMNRFQWMWRAYPFAADAVACQKTAFNFVDSIWETWGPLLHGVPLVLVPAALRQDPERMVELLAREAVTHIVLVPSLLRHLLELSPPIETRLPHLIHWTCSGEALPTELADLFRARLPRARLLNLYGSSEVSADVTHEPTWELPPGARVTLGRPIANTWIRVLGPDLELLPIGVPGEIWVGGANLNRGYLGRPELSDERFQPDPHHPGHRIYRTGDRGRWLPDGRLDYLGRVDHQVKLRGVRIELAEVEAAVLAHPGVTQCLVTLHDGPTGPALVAHVVHPADGFTAADLRETLRRRLPEAMVPAHILALPALPLTPNGKVDRARLPRPDATPALAERRPAAPLRSALERQIAGVLREVLQLERVGPTDNFFDLGGNSLLLARALTRLRAELGRDDLTMVQLFQHPNVRSLAEALGGADEPEPVHDHGRARARLRRERAGADDDIAIIGMACRFPGASTLEQYWDNLVRGVESITRFSEHELRAAGVAERDLRDPAYVRARPILDGIDQFDAGFFGFGDREAALLDPQQRLFLECCWQALEAAGYQPDRVPGSVGVFAGAGLPSYLLGNANLRDQPMSEIFRTVLGSDKDYLATRVSYKLNLRGPSVTVQTACSTSLVAVSMACDSLRAGQSSLALAGAVSIQVPQRSGYRHEEGMILSPDGRCRPFDARAGGTLFGNGLGVVALKRLADARADGDIIHAVIRGVAINNDGAAKAGYTAPSVEGQARVIAEALAMARVDPDSIGYVEAHGTATALGDPIEVAALTRVLRTRTRARNSCGLGSVKSNIGHLDTAAGVAGLIKGVLMLRHGVLPPSLHFERPNPHLGLDDSPFFVPRVAQPWAHAGDAPRRLGVSAFGIGGTNAHLILEAAPAPGDEP